MKKKRVPFHIKYNYKQFQLGAEGPKFWARDEADAELYCKKIGWSPLGLKGIAGDKEDVIQYRDPGDENHENI